MVESGLFLVSEIELDWDNFSRLKPADKFKCLEIEKLHTYTYIVHVTCHKVLPSSAIRIIANVR